MKRLPRILAAGDRAVTIELGDTIDLEVSARVQALARGLMLNPLPGQLECIPAIRSVLVLFNVQAPSPQAVFEQIARRWETPPPPAAVRRHEIPVRYGGADGPDLSEVSTRLGLAEGAVVRLHGSEEYTALMLGFTPGFAYLGALPAALALPRRETPRTSVARGSVAIAGRLTGIYPSASAGGWHLLGRSALTLFDPYHDPPAVIAPGDRVRFIATNASLLSSLPSPPRVDEGEPVAEVLDGGTLTSVQDLGRPGYRRYGVSLSGAMDAESLMAANNTLGNDSGAAALECALSGLAFRFLAGGYFAIAGADLGAVLARDDLGRWPVPMGKAVRARPGNVLTLEKRERGCRAYIAFTGGLEVPIVLGSRSTDLGAGFGGFLGRALRAGDVLRRGSLRREPPEGKNSPPAPPGGAELRLFRGPQYDALEPQARDDMLNGEYTVSSSSNRAGCRFTGPPLRCSTSGDTVSDGMPVGSIEVPPDGQPIITGVEGPTTGGYPKPFVVATVDLDKLGQLVPGESRVRLRLVEG